MLATDIAALESLLDSEIRCESDHSNPEQLACSVEVEFRLTMLCGPRGVVCRNVYAVFVAWGSVGGECICGDSIESCWSFLPI